MRDIKTKRLPLIFAVLLFVVATIYSGNRGVKNPDIEVIPMTSNEISLNELINEGVLSQEKLELEIISIRNKKDVTVYFNDKKVMYEVEPTYIDDKLMIPIRHTLEAMGFEVEWSNNEASAGVIKNSSKTKAYINDNIYFKEKEKTFSLSQAPQIVDGRTLVPIEFFHETLGLEFEVKEGKVIFFRDDNELSPLNTYKGYLTKATRGNDSITYHLSDTREGEITKIVEVKNDNSFYQKIPQLGNYINIIGNLEENKYIGIVIY